MNDLRFYYIERHERNDINACHINAMAAKIKCSRKYSISQTVPIYRIIRVCPHIGEIYATITGIKSTRAKAAVAGFRIYLFAKTSMCTHIIHIHVDFCRLPAWFSSFRTSTHTHSDTIKKRRRRQRRCMLCTY